MDHYFVPFPHYSEQGQGDFLYLKCKIIGMLEKIICGSALISEGAKKKKKKWNKRIYLELC